MTLTMTPRRNDACRTVACAMACVMLSGPAALAVGGFIASEDFASGAGEWVEWIEAGNPGPEGDMGRTVTHVNGPGEGSGNGYVRSELGDLAPDAGGIYGTCYVAGQSPGGFTGDFGGASVSAALNSLGTADLKDGNVYFFVGEWNTTAGQGKWYYFDQPFTIGDNQWAVSQTILTENVNDWTGWGQWTGKTFAQLLVDPEQWGFVIEGETAAPSGQLAFDNIIVTNGPAVTISQAAGQPDPTNDDAIDFAFVFTQNVQPFGQGAVILGGTANPVTATVTGGGANYNVAVSGMGSDGTVTISMYAGAVQSYEGDANQRAIHADNEVTYDGTEPVVSVDPLTTPDTTPPLSGTVSDANATIKVTVNGKAYSAQHMPKGRWGLADNTIDPPLAPGPYDVAVSATDAVGNVGNDNSNNELIILGGTVPTLGEWGIAGLVLALGIAASRRMRRR